MSAISKKRIANGIYWVEIPDAHLYILCGSPADSIKHLIKRGLIVSEEINGVKFETGPNVILLSDVPIQNGSFANLAEFPVLQMLYRQGMILEGHPNNRGIKPLLLGSAKQIKSQVEYIYRGNYGLISEEELVDAGVSPETAHEMMRLKLIFAQGKIRSPAEFFDSRTVDSDPVELRNGVFIRRIKVNIFEFQYKDELTTINLNLAPHESYEAPYPLGFYNIKREYFAVVHSGEGNGWDANRPCMASIIMFQGKIYLIDAGPNILYSLRSLGIGANEIEGIFQTHAHDDHFSGLTALMRSDHKIKYFAAPVVRTSVTKKLSALTTIAEEELNNYFDVHDLEVEIWNDVDGLEVKPIFSPHPIETTTFLFRALCNEGYRSYAHFADLASLEVLKSMINDNTSEPGLSRELFCMVQKNYLTRADLKKLDVEGGLIHGSSVDFQSDTSGKIILSHVSSQLTRQQKEIGSGTSFGMVDVIIPSNQDYIWQYAFLYLQSHFPSVPHHQIQMLLNNPIVTFNAETILIRKDEVNRNIFFILTGDVEVIRSGSGIVRKMSSGGVAGDNSTLSGSLSKETYRAVSFVQALQVPCELYLDFIKRNGLYDDIMNLQQKREFLQNTWLFSEGISHPVQNRLARSMTLQSYPDKEEILKEERLGLHLVKHGQLEIFINEDLFETVHTGNFVGSGSVLLGTLSLFQVRALKNTEVYYIPRDALLDIPIVYWKLVEIYDKRMRMILNPDLISIPIFQWRNEYNINVSEMDNDHKRLFEISNRLYEAIHSGVSRSELESILNLIISHTGQHFDKEEDLMEMHNFPETNIQRKEHMLFTETVLEYKRKFKSYEIEIDMEFINLIKDWVINHILTEDRKYGVYLNRERVF